MPTLGKQKILKQINRKHILNMLREHDEISIAGLSKNGNEDLDSVVDKIADLYY